MNENPRLLSRSELNRIVQRVMNVPIDSPSSTRVSITGWWNAELRWARNRVSLSGDRRDVTVEVQVSVVGNRGRAFTNQLDDVSVEATVRAAERAAKIFPLQEFPQMALETPTLPSPTVMIWSDATANITNEQRAGIAEQLTSMSENRGFLSAGYLEMRVGEVVSFDSELQRPSEMSYQAFTQAQCSATVRHPQGVGSGWAGLSSYDWSSIDGSKLVQRAVEKCQASLNAVRIEPGRYTTILEPQASAAMCDGVAGSFARFIAGAETGRGPWFLEGDLSLNINRSKLGLKVVDERISFSHDPQNSELGVLTRPGLAPIEWIKDGVLNTLEYDRNYALEMLEENSGQLARPSYSIKGGNTSMDEMIATTKRGLIVTRFWGIRGLDPVSLLCTGVTRDGLWLIENGKITKAVKNFRFTESPLFMLNQLVQIGPAERVFRPVVDPYDAQLTPAIVPALKVNDFSFTSTIDAV